MLVQYPGGKRGSYTIPNSVTCIGENAFYDCFRPTSITIPNSVTNIGEWAFFNCSALTSIEIPNSVTSIGDCAFYKCSALTRAIIGNSVTSIGEKAFAGCYGLTSIEIPNSVISIGRYAFISCIALTSVTIGNSVTSIGECAFCKCSSLTCVTIGNSVTSIGEQAFSSCRSLTSVTIPNSVTSIGDEAFSGCTGLTSITCEAVTPPSCDGSNVFYGVNKSIPLYVPFGSVDAYIAADVWKYFMNILPIQAENVEVTTTTITATESTANVAWPQISGAYTYELVIKDASGNIVCTLIFNAQGQLVSIAFNAPAQNGAPQHTQAAGLAFTVTGLEAGTTYNYAIVAKNEAGAVLNTETGSFTTLGGTQVIDDVNANANANAIKFLRDGQILIQKGDKIFDLRGQEVR